jgi:branched-chain amino acid transport system ATP-binding protein
MDMAPTELLLEEVSAGYGETSVLERVSLSVARGERLGIIGRNGAGKTTTLATAMGLTRLRHGMVSFNGKDVSKLRPNARAAMGLGYVPQTRDIFPSLTVEENLCAGMKTRSRAEVSKLLAEAYVMFPRLKERRTNWGNALSGGEQQMLSIARSLMGQPSILLLDEPLEGLAPVVAQELMSAIHSLVINRGIGCVLVEQHVGLVMNFCSQILVLERGRPAFYGTSETLRTTHGHVLEQSIGLGKVPATPSNTS